MTRSFRTLLVLTAASFAFAGEAATDSACSMLFAKSAELDYYRSETPEARRQAEKELQTWFGELRASTNTPVASSDLRVAWWRIAFARGNIRVPYADGLSPNEMRLLATAADPRKSLQALRTAHRISDFRKRVNRLFARTGSLLRRPLDRVSTRVPESWIDRVKRFPDFLVVRASVSNANRAQTITLRAALQLRSLLLTGIDFLSPLHLHTFLPEKWLERTRPVFAKLEQNPAYVASGEDLTILRRYGAEDAFAKRKALLLKNPRWFKTLRVADTVHRWGIAGLGAGAIGLAVVQSAWGDGAPITAEEYLNDPKNRLLPNQIQILNETFPIPHLAIRIGDLVYSYGVSHVTATPIAVYLRIAGRDADFFERQRSVQIMTLDLGPGQADRMRKHFETAEGKAYDFDAIAAEVNPEYRRLRRYLSLQENKRYENITLVNDCASMVARALRRETSIFIPTTIDPSPSSIMLYLGLEKLQGDPRIGKVQLVKASAEPNSLLHLLRNAYVNAREARLFYHPVGFAVAHGYRSVIDATRNDSELQAFDVDFLERERMRKDEVEAAVRGDGDLAFFLKQKAKLAGDSALRRQAQNFFERTYDENLGAVETDYGDLDRTLGALYRLQYYSEAEREILGRRTFDLERALDDPQFFTQIQSLLESLETPLDSLKN